MITSSCASVRFVASLLTTTQKLPEIRPPRLARYADHREDRLGVGLEPVRA